MPVTIFLALLTVSLLLRCGRGEETAVNNDPQDILVLLSDLLQELKGLRADMQVTGNRIPSDCKSSVLVQDDMTHSAPKAEVHLEEKTSPEESSHTAPTSLWRTLLGVRNLQHAVVVAFVMIMTAVTGLTILAVLILFSDAMTSRSAEERVWFIGSWVGIPIGFLLLFNICSRYIIT